MSHPKSHLACPVCGKPLCVAQAGATIMLWCGHGPCPSQVANDGAEGRTEAEAFERLELKLEHETNQEI